MHIEHVQWNPSEINGHHAFGPNLGPLQCTGVSFAEPVISGPHPSHSCGDLLCEVRRWTMQNMRFHQLQALILGFIANDGCQ